MSKFTAADLVEFYQKVADGGVIEVSHADNVWRTTDITGPSPVCLQKHWRIKPAKKIIDMAHFIRSGIDCEFRDDDAHKWVIASLWNIELLPEWIYYGSDDFKGVRHCRPRMNHKMFHDGGECPIPSGFRGHVYLRDGQVGHHGETTLATWSHDNDSFDIIGYEILGLADGWAYPWESE